MTVLRPSVHVSVVNAESDVVDVGGDEALVVVGGLVDFDSDSPPHATSAIVTEIKPTALNVVDMGEPLRHLYMVKVEVQSLSVFRT